VGPSGSYPIRLLSLEIKAGPEQFEDLTMISSLGNNLAQRRK